MENRATLIDKLKETIQTIKNTEIIKFFIGLNLNKYTLSIIGFMLLYFFYQLGYVFLYGFYFGGDGQSSIFNISINPIPFNFKAIIGVGVILLIFISMFCIPLISILFSKLNIYSIICLLASSYVVIFSLMYMFFGEGMRSKVLGLALVALGVPFATCYIIYVMINFKTYLKSTIISIFHYFIILFILYSLGLGINNNEKSIIVVLTIIYILVLIPIMNKRIEKLNSIRVKTWKEVITIILFIIILLIYQSRTNEGIYISVLIYSLTLTYIEIITNKTMTIIKSRIIKYILINNKAEDITKYKIIINIFAGIMLIAFLYPVVSYVILTYGSYLGHVTMNSYSPNKISYEFNKDGLVSDEINGLIVAQQGDTYYISQLPYRKLAIIKSKSIIVY